MNHTTNPKPGDMIKITHRLCPPKVQPHIKPGDTYAVRAIVRNDCTTLTVQRSKLDTRTYSLRSDRFAWETISLDTLNKDNELKHYRSLANQVKENFTPKEQVRIAYIPHIITELAFRYLEQCNQYCAENKVSVFKKLSRATKDARREWDFYMAKDLKPDGAKMLKQQVTDFVSEESLFFLQIQMSVTNELNRQLPDKTQPITHEPLRVLAATGRWLIGCFLAWNIEHDDLVAKRMGGVRTTPKTLQEQLGHAFNAFVGQYSLTPVQKLHDWYQVLRNKIISQDFTVTK